MRTIFLSSGGYEKFVSCVMDAIEKYGAILHVFGLIASRYPLIVATSKANIFYKEYAVSSSRKHTSLSNTANTEIGSYFGGIS